MGMGVGVGVGMGAHPCEGVGEVAGVSPRSNMTVAVTRRYSLPINFRCTCRSSGIWFQISYSDGVR